MPIQDDFSVSGGAIRHVAGTTIYPVLDLHAWLQDLGDDAQASGDDALSILDPNPSRLDGPRDPAVPSRLNLLTSGTVIYNIDDEAAKFINFGSIKQKNGDEQFSGLKTIGGIVSGSPVYVVQGGNKITKFWPNGHVQIMIKVRSSGALISNGDVTAFSRKWGQTYSHFDVNLAAGGENNAALNTLIDGNITLTEAQAAALSAKVTITFGNTTQDLGNGNGAKLYKGTIALSGGCTLAEAYHYLQYITREASAVTLNGTPGWRYRKLDPTYDEIPSAPFGTFAGGTLFAARGWFVTGVLASESTRYRLIADDNSEQAPPRFATITIGNLVAGDRVLVARSDGSGAAIQDEYTPVAASAGATSLTVVEPIATDTPASGVIRVAGRLHTYAAYNTGTKTFTGLSPALAANVVASDNVFVPFIDRVATGATESVSFRYAADFNVRLDVRRGTVNPIIPFDTIVPVTETGGSANASRNSDI